MDSIPNDLLEIKNRLDSFRLQRSYQSEPWPPELKFDILTIATKYPENVVRKVLKVHPERLTGNNKSKSKAKPSKVKNNSTFFTLPSIETVLQTQASTIANQDQCRIALERSDGTRLTLTLQSMDAVQIISVCSGLLRA